MKCPNCASDDTMTHKMAYLSHITRSTGKDSSAGLTMASTPSLNIGVSRSESQSQVSLVDEVQPPPAPADRLKVFLGALTLAALAAVVLTRVFDFGLKGFTTLWAVIALAILILNVLAEEKTSNEYEAAKRRWETSWICMRCGYKWHKKD